MTEFQITYWRDIPSMVVAREGPGNRHKIQLSARFQVAIDEAAMRAGATGTDEYLDGWLRRTGRSRLEIPRRWPWLSPRSLKPTIPRDEYARCWRRLSPTLLPAHG